MLSAKYSNEPALGVSIRSLTDSKEMSLSLSAVKANVLSMDVQVLFCTVPSEATTRLDLDKDEDCSCDADFNFILTAKGSLIEVQGTAEGMPVSWKQFDACRDVAVDSVKLLAEELGLTDSD